MIKKLTIINYNYNISILCDKFMTKLRININFKSYVTYISKFTQNIPRTPY